MSSTGKITKILIANRGEIAVRVIKSARKLGIKTVAVYSDVDANAKFVQLADESYALGGNTSKESYLIIDKIIAACKQTGANAVHPGYGFLSENHEFVNRCEKEGIIFIGPSVKSMQMMGDKITSKETAKNAGVSIVPGFLGIINSKEDAEKIAKDIGFPVIIKASAGGGGKGMKIVYELEDLFDAIESAKNEAKNAFGDDRLFIEKYIERPHHIEIQIIADKSGNVVCLGERECSIQRFNQKVIEESPSPSISKETREKMYEQSTRLAKGCGYYSAGTVEYIMDANQNFYFLEMNTRLQVEHPVTEYVTGKDLVELMIQVAEGEKLPFTQNDIQIKGWAMECRICAEDPSNGFIPSVGRISLYREPSPMHNVEFRIDSGVIEGSEVSPFYDSMIAKAITYGDTRKEAVNSMKKVVGKFEIAGVLTNMNLLEDILRNEDFVSGKISTWFIQEKYPNGFKDFKIKDDSKRFIVAAIAKFYYENELNRWSISGQFELTRDDDDSVVISFNGDEYKVKFIDYNHDKIVILINSETVEFSSNYDLGTSVVDIKIADREKYIKILSKNENHIIITCDGIITKVVCNPTHIQEYQKYMPVIELNQKTTELLSPITGVVLKILVSEGEVVKPGQGLVVIEAMKMENIIRADFDTTIKSINVKPGQTIATDDMIFSYENS